ncbi:MAG TPA: site-specific integrase [Candidatus Cybelea sp.]|jgi:integrase
MATTILPQLPPAGASADNSEYVRQADGRTLRVDRSKCFASPCPGCSNCDTFCPLETVETVERAREYAEAAQAENTRRAYRVGWNDFALYCGAQGFVSLPASPQTVALYVTQLAERAKLATIRLYIAGIAERHRAAGLDSPLAHDMVRRIVRGIARTKGASQGRKSAVTLDHLRAMLLEIRGGDVKAKRDRAVVLLGFAAALRRSEIAALRVEDLRFEKRGLIVTIRRSKTDQEGNGAELAIPYVANGTLCAARAVKAWLAASGITTGPLFRSFNLQRQMLESPISGRDVANLVKKLTTKARLDGDFSGHSLRAGFATSAAAAKVSLDAIARTTRHKSLSVLMGYVRPAQAFDDVALSSMIA